MNSDIYEETKQAKLKQLVLDVKNGSFPVVVINDDMFSEYYLESGMKARVVGVKHLGVETDSEMADFKDERVEFSLNFKEFDIENQKIEKANCHNPKTNAFDLTATEAGIKPHNFVEIVFHSMTYGAPFMDVEEYNSIKNEFFESKTKLNYISWLEKLVQDLRN